MTRKLTCIVCPLGCEITVELDGDKNVLSVEGNTCKRGEAYAKTECTAPQRTVTSTAAIMGGGVVPVKTDKTIPKELIFECMKEIDALRVSPNAKLGDVLIPNVLGTNANVVATRDALIDKQ